jgi:GT2 family glycosyltransferase
VIGEAGLVPAPLAVWIDGEPGSEATLRTESALAAGSAQPAAVLQGPLRQALAEVRTRELILLRAGDVLAPSALERFGQAVRLAPDAEVITCDEDQLDAGDRRQTPRFRPGPSPDHWLACDASGTSLVIAREPAASLLGQLSGGAAWRHELALALAGPAGERAAHVPLLLSHRGAEMAEPPPLEGEAVRRVLARWEPEARVEVAGGFRRVRRRHGREPIIEVIVCLRDRPELLARCVVSLLARTDYERLSVALVDNGSRETRTLELLAGLERRERVRVMHDDRPFNFAALNNAAARSSNAEVLVFLNNDTEIVDPAWITPLLEEALRPEVGAVAPMLLYPDGTVQHAGVALGLHGYAGHPFAGLAPGSTTPFGQAEAGTRNWLAVTAACLMVQRSKFDGAGGFDESFVVAGNDVDLCLRLTAAGHRSLCTPQAVVLHDESRSRGAHIDPGDFVRSEHSYGEFRTVGDPFYNPNLTLSRTDCTLRTPAEGAT